MNLAPFAGSGGSVLVHRVAEAFYRRLLRSQIAQLRAMALPSGFSIKALMLMVALISSGVGGREQSYEELICFVDIRASSRSA